MGDVQYTAFAVLAAGNQILTEVPPSPDAFVGWQ
jgi:hypothetical protein